MTWQHRTSLVFGEVMQCGRLHALQLVKPGFTCAHECKTEVCASTDEDHTQCSLNAADVADCGMKLSEGNAWMISCNFVVVRVLME